MQCDLARLFGKLAAELPHDPAGQGTFILSSENLPLPPARLETDRLVIKQSYHNYGMAAGKDLNALFQVDVLHFQALSETYRHLGLLILAILFHPEIDQVEIKLTHPESPVKYLIVHYTHPQFKTLSGYASRPFAFGFQPRSTEGYLEIASHHPPVELPCFYLAHRDGPAYSEDAWNYRDTVIGFGGDIASAWLAELLLDAGLLGNEVNHYHLEGELGWRAVGPGSAEAEFHLPGSPGWQNLF